ncbi:glycosyl hydrolase [uncultured Litoreibacter sp.]|uniref:glycosyl hydrolase n=1 Tax=uncultured Litoreibacter sp. TaxID=1392394 RepID=UPI00262694BD|nr:glycosyl hydrolase [uncultured Litoreibacter sp.]
MYKFLKLVIASALFACLSTVAHAQKAGVGAWENPDFTMLGWIEETPALGWYYNWRPDQIYSKTSHRRTVEFVPMIHSAKDINKRIRSNVTVRNLLAFNEPDGHGNMSVGQAIKLWPKLERRGLRLSSPATKRGNTLGKNSWQYQFMKEAEARGLRVDFMAVHYYSTNGSIPEFRNWLRAVHAAYKRPIWVTEFALIDWHRPSRTTHQQNAKFATDAIRMMESLPFVERHAWFAANPYKWNGQTPRLNLVNNDLTLTATGRAFDRVLGQIGSRHVSANDRTPLGPRALRN